MLTAGQTCLCIGGQDDEWGYTDGQNMHGVAIARKWDVVERVGSNAVGSGHCVGEVIEFTDTYVGVTRDDEPG